jgi:hypothetical protein
MAYASNNDVVQETFKILASSDVVVECLGISDMVKCLGIFSRWNTLEFLVTGWRRCA